MSVESCPYIGGLIILVVLSSRVNDLRMVTNPNDTEVAIEEILAIIRTIRYGGCYNLTITIYSVIIKKLLLLLLLLLLSIMKYIYIYHIYISYQVPRILPR